jgi:hypothetical protein
LSGALLLDPSKRRRAATQTVGNAIKLDSIAKFSLQGNESKIIQVVVTLKHIDEEGIFF